jgi:site-specific DNA-methyltransferase (adenine-specific)
LAVAVEDAGFELRDSIAWIYGSGFPKSLDVSKAIDKNLGVEREVTGRVIAGIAPGTGNAVGGPKPFVDLKENPITPDAKAWEGWGTALKPAFEPVVVGRKPFGKGVTVAENVLAWGVGGLNIDGSRIGTEATTTQHTKRPCGPSIVGNGAKATGETTVNPPGRWPANVILDEVTAGLLDEQSGVSKSSGSMRGSGGGSEMIGQLNNREDSFRGHNDQGGASRFFYVAKASKRDRNEGLEELEDGDTPYRSHRPNFENTKGVETPFAGAGRSGKNLKNFHPTVKPTALMRYLIKLVTPPGGTVLDPFTGSGSTGKAALLDGFQFVGVELTEEYLPIIEGRLRWASEQVDDDGTLF